MWLLIAVFVVMNDVEVSRIEMPSEDACAAAIKTLSASGIASFKGATCLEIGS